MHLPDGCRNGGHILHILNDNLMGQKTLVYGLYNGGIILMNPYGPVMLAVYFHGASCSFVSDFIAGIACSFLENILG